MSYATTLQVWQNLGKDAFTKVASEVLGTGNATTSTWNFDHDNLIDSTYTIYTDGNTVSTASYTINLDKGQITGLTAGNNVEVTADYYYSDIEDSWVSQMISSSDKLVEGLTGRTYDSSSTTEYLDVDPKQKDFFLRYYPVLTISALSSNTASTEADSPAWTASTQGLGNDYIANARDLEIGRIRFIDNYPYAGRDRLAVTYSYGYATTPALVKELSILIATRQMINSAVYKAIFKGQDNFSPTRLEEIENRIQELTKVLRKQNISPV